MVIGRADEVRHPMLKKLKTAKKLIRFIQESGDRQWASRVRRRGGGGEGGAVRCFFFFWLLAV